MSTMVKNEKNQAVLTFEISKAAMDEQQRRFF